MTPLRRRLIEDLQLRNYSPHTVKGYVRAVERLARFYGRSPDRITPEEIRTFQLHLRQRCVSWGLFNQVVCGLRFFFTITLGQPNLCLTSPMAKNPRLYRWSSAPTKSASCSRRVTAYATESSSRPPMPAACV